MDRLTESKFGLEVVGRSSEFRLGLLVRKTGLLSLASWIKNGSRPRLSITVDPASTGRIVVQSIHSREDEPAMPWLMVDASGGTLDDAPGSPYGKVLHLTPTGSLRVQVSRDPVVNIRAEGPVHLSVRFADREQSISMSSGEVVTLRPARTPMVPQNEPSPAPAVREWSKAQRLFVERARAEKLTTVAVHTPRWLGVSNSTRVLFERCYPVPECGSHAPADLTQEDIRQHADVLIASGVRRVIFSGGDDAHHQLMLALRERDPALRFDLVFHGNFTQLQDPYVWHIFKLWADSAREGVLHTFVTMKKGGEEVLRAAGIPSEYLINYLPGEVQPPPNVATDRVHVGIWFSGPAFKSPLPMLGACRLIENATLHGAGMGPHGELFASYLGLNRGFFSEHPVSKDELAARMRNTHISLYVTAAECSPMLPLESLQLGVPCLVGPSSHLFEDNPFLFDRLVVPFPDRPEVIARYARRAFDERREIIEEWARYAPQYNEQARQRVERFLREG